MTSSNENPIEIPVKVLTPDDWTEPTRYRVTKTTKIAGYTVPEGFITDGASVPRFLWWLFPPVGRYFAAAVVHDHALASGLGWGESNDLFKEVLRDLGIAAWRRELMVAAVRLNGVWQKGKAAIGLDGRYVK